MSRHPCRQLLVQLILWNEKFIIHCILFPIDSPSHSDMMLDSAGVILDDHIEPIGGLIIPVHTGDK